jgi:hypothetical protein
MKVWVVSSHEGYGENNSVDVVFSTEQAALMYVEEKKGGGTSLFYYAEEFEVRD